MRSASANRTRASSTSPPGPWAPVPGGAGTSATRSTAMSWPADERAPVTADAHRSVKGLTLTIFNNVSDLVGRTPLIRVNKASERSGAEVIAKLESYNPANSVKDRIGVAMIDAAEKSGELKPGGTIVEATSGNTGIALAMIGTSRGYRVKLTMPESMSKERRALLRAFGAEL